MTQSIRKQLRVLFNKFNITSILDSLCGDFNWMQFVDLRGVSYIGGEIVQPLVKELNTKYSMQDVFFYKWISHRNFS